MLLWLDLETTGLDPVHNRILEAGWVVTRDSLQPLDPWREVVQSTLITPSLEAWDQLDELVTTWDLPMRNGLYDDLKEEGTLRLEDAEDMILTDLDYASEEDIKFILAGSGVHFDKAFIDIWMPRLAKRLHYRIFDMSTIKRFLATVGGFESDETETHRAGQDVAEALANARTWQAKLISSRLLGV